MKNRCLSLSLALLMIVTMSCIGIQDGGEPPGGPPTLGRELIDLKKAQDVGAISYEEYKQLKAKLVESYE